MKKVGKQGQETQGTQVNDPSITSERKRYVLTIIILKSEPRPISPLSASTFHTSYNTWKAA